MNVHIEICVLLFYKDDLKKVDENDPNNKYVISY